MSMMEANKGKRRHSDCSIAINSMEEDYARIWDAL
jgi:hypothetical protein